MITFTLQMQKFIVCDLVAVAVSNHCVAITVCGRLRVVTFRNTSCCVLITFNRNGFHDIWQIHDDIDRSFTVLPGYGGRWCGGTNNVRSWGSYCRALMMLMNSGLSDAPPTRNPSTSGWCASSEQFSAVTEPTKTAFTQFANKCPVSIKCWMSNKRRGIDF